MLEALLALWVTCRTPAAKFDSRGAPPAAESGFLSIVRDALASNDADHRFVRLENRRLPESVRAVAHRLDGLMRSDRLRVARLPGTEYLLSIGRDGTVLDIVEGTEATVALRRSFDEPLRVAGAGIVLVHNHPGGSGFSGADLGQLGKAGVDGMIAVGHDGSIYAASAGPSYDSTQFESWLYPLARSAVLRHLRAEAPAANIVMAVFNGHIEHLVAVALQKAGAIQYDARVSDDPRQRSAVLATVYGRVVEATGAVLVREIKKKQANRSAQRR